MIKFEDFLEELGKPEATTPRNKMQTARDFFNNHGEVVIEVASIIEEGKKDPTLDVQYQVIQTVETASKANSNALASFSPTELFDYTKRVLNERLLKYGRKVIRGRMVALQLTHEPEGE